MAFIRTAVDPETLRHACQVADATEITVYDADFPSELGQRFVTAIVRNTAGKEEEFDLTSMDWRGLNHFIEEEADVSGDSVKFVLDLGEPDVITVKLEIENHYEDGDQVTTHVDTTVPPPPDEDDEDAVDEWEQNWIFPHTGTGQTEGDSSYFVEVVESSDPEAIPVGTEYEFGL